jgi:hypothetical protein
MFDQAQIELHLPDGEKVGMRGLGLPVLIANVDPPHPALSPLGRGF